MFDRYMICLFAMNPVENLPFSIKIDRKTDFDIKIDTDKAFGKFLYDCGKKYVKITLHIK